MKKERELTGVRVDMRQYRDSVRQDAADLDLFRRYVQRYTGIPCSRIWMTRSAATRTFLLVAGVMAVGVGALKYMVGWSPSFSSLWLFPLAATLFMVSAMLLTIAVLGAKHLLPKRRRARLEPEETFRVYVTKRLDDVVKTMLVTPGLGMKSPLGTFFWYKDEFGDKGEVSEVERHREIYRTLREHCIGLERWKRTLYHQIAKWMEPDCSERDEVWRSILEISDRLFGEIRALERLRTETAGVWFNRTNTFQYRYEESASLCETFTRAAAAHYGLGAPRFAKGEGELAIQTQIESWPDASRADEYLEQTIVHGGVDAPERNRR